MKPKVVVLFAGMVLPLLAGCFALPCESLNGCPTPSLAYQQADGLAPDQRDAFFKTLPIEQRLDAYHDIYSRSGHPHVTAAWIFEGAGQAGFDAAMARMVNPASFSEYFWVVSWLARDGEIDICDPVRFNRLKEKIDRYGKSDLAHPVPIRFDRCEVVL